MAGDPDPASERVPGFVGRLGTARDDGERARSMALRDCGRRASRRRRVVSRPGVGVLLATACCALPASAQRGGARPVAVAVFFGPAVHSMADWNDGMDELEARARSNGLNPQRASELSWFAGAKATIELNEKLDGEVVVERLGASPEFSAEDAIGGVFGNERATFGYHVAATALVLRAGVRRGVWDSGRARAFLAGSAGLAAVDVDFSSPNASASGSGTGVAVAVGAGLERRQRRFRPVLEVGYRVLTVAPQYRPRLSSAGGSGRFLFAGEADLREFVQGRKAQLGGAYLLVGLGLGF